jgi:DNA-directed RNA polymerase beta' subunit
MLKKNSIKEKEIIYIDVEEDIQNIYQPEIDLKNKSKMKKTHLIQKNETRFLTEEEKEYLCDFLVINESKDFETEICTLENIKIDILEQLKNIKIYPHLLDELKNEIKKNYYKTQLHPGHMVGVDSATSLGEPTTQMTLNSFHSAGKTCAAVTTGVPRFRELLDTSKQQKHTLITFTLKNENEPKNIEEAKRICKSFDEKRIFHLLKLSIPNIYNQINQDIQNNQENDINILSDLNIDKSWYEYFEIFINNNYLNYKWYLRLEFNIDLIYEYKITLEHISNCIEKELPTCSCVYSPDYIGIIDVYINTENINTDDILFFRKQIDNIKKNDKNKKQSFINNSNKKYYYIRDIFFQYVINIKVSGIDSIEKSYFRQIDNGIDKNKWFFELEGTNFIEILNNPNINYKNCMINNMWEIYNTLGIEAVRQFLINEFNEIITSGGINVDKVHLELLADSMTYTGNITSVSRYGIGRNETGPLTKASFEQSLDNMLIAAYKSETEQITSVSSSVILGQCSKIGSGMIDLYNKIM